MELKQQQQHNLPASSSSSATPYQRHSLGAASNPFTVRVRRKSLANLPAIGEKLSAIFGVQLQEAILDDDLQQQQPQQHQFISFLVLDESTGCQVLASTASGGSVATGASGGDLIAHIQVSSSDTF
uniref:Uncharacterized protein n=1 Tax=Anopheles triannulatus TaxID=58253 RepID=A0A2M4AZP8_9DIPT